MAISQKRKSANSKSSQNTSQPNEEASSDKKAKTVADQASPNIQSSQTSKVYQRFKKLVEKASLQKRQAQANTIQARSDLKSRKKAAAAAALLDEANENQVDSAQEKTYFDLNYSKQNLIEKRAFFDRSLRDLNEKLKFVKEIGTNANALTSSSIEDKDFEREYIDQIKALDQETAENLSNIKFWHDKQQKEIERQFKIDNKQCVREFQKKRGDLKKKLMHKYDDMKKQVEVENTLLDINMDLHEMSKVPRTRNLRKRINTNVLMYNFDYSIDWLSLDAALAAKKSHASIDILARCAAGEHTAFVDHIVENIKPENENEFNKSNLCSSETDVNNNVLYESAVIADHVASNFE
jgi:hypothetical protein